MLAGAPGTSAALEKKTLERQTKSAITTQPKGTRKNDAYVLATLSNSPLPKKVRTH